MTGRPARDGLHAPERRHEVAQEGLRALADGAQRCPLDQLDAAGLAPLEPDHREHGGRAPERGAEHRVAVGQARELLAPGRARVRASARGDEPAKGDPART